MLYYSGYISDANIIEIFQSKYSATKKIQMLHTGITRTGDFFKKAIRGISSFWPKASLPQAPASA